MSGGDECAVDFGVNGIGIPVFSYGNCQIVIVPVLIPHKHKARFVTLNNETAREDSSLCSAPDANPQSFIRGIVNKRTITYVPAEQTGFANYVASEQCPIYDVRESKFTSLIGGVIALLACQPVAVGFGILGQGRWQVESHRKVIGERDVAYNCHELRPPKSLKKVQGWCDNYTKISWLEAYGVQGVGGVYAIAHAGGSVTLEGIWKKTVERTWEVNDEYPNGVELIRVSLSLKKQFRAGTILGVIPFLSHRKDLAHAAKTNEITFTFTNVNDHQEAKDILKKLIKGRDKNAVRDAFEMSARDGHAIGAAVRFERKKNGIIREGKGRFRLRVPLIANRQSVNKKREKKERVTLNVGGELQRQKVKVSEKYKRKEYQYPIDWSLREQEKRVYPDRLGIDSHHHLKWPLDYRSHTAFRSIKVYDTIQGQDDTALNMTRASFVWQKNDNYISRKSCLASLRHLAAKTGLGPLLLDPDTIPDFTGPPSQANNHKESMAMQLTVQLSEDDLGRLIDNILSGAFTDSVIGLFDNYTTHPRGDYLQLARHYPEPALQNYGIMNRPILEEKCHKVINKVRSEGKKLSGENSGFLTFFNSGKLSNKERRHAHRSVLNAIKDSPFIFLAALENTNPVSQFTFEQTSMEKVEKRIDIPLALDIMNHNADFPNDNHHYAHL